MTTTMFNSTSNKQTFCIRILYQDQQRHLFSRIVHTKKVQAKDLSTSTAIHSCPSAKVQDLLNIVKQYNGYHKIENLIIHVGHNNIDSGNSGFETATILMETASEIIQKPSSLKVALCKIPPVKDGFLVHSKNNDNMNKYNEALENVATELNGVFDIDLVFLIYCKRKMSAMMEYTHQSAKIYLKLSERLGISMWVNFLRCQKLK